MLDLRSTERRGDKRFVLIVLWGETFCISLIVVQGKSAGQHRLKLPLKKKRAIVPSRRGKRNLKGKERISIRRGGEACATSFRVRGDFKKKHWE